jgi:putative transposase
VVLRVTVDHFNTHRPHRSLGKTPPVRASPAPATVDDFVVRRRQRLCGLINEYTNPQAA